MANNIQKSKTGEFLVELDAIVYKDLETGLFISYCPALDISAYEDSEKKAKASLMPIIKDLIKELDAKGNLEKYLFDLGWNMMRNPKPSFVPPSLNLVDILKMKPKTAWKQEFGIPYHSNKSRIPVDC